LSGSWSSNSSSYSSSSESELSRSTTSKARAGNRRIRKMGVPHPHMRYCWYSITSSCRLYSPTLASARRSLQLPILAHNDDYQILPPVKTSLEVLAVTLMLAVRLSYKNGMGAWPSQVKSYTRRKQRLHYTYSKKVATLAINLSTILKFSSCVLFKCHYHQALKLKLGAWRRRCPAGSIIKLLPAASAVPFMPGGHLTLTFWHKIPHKTRPW